MQQLGAGVARRLFVSVLAPYANRVHRPASAKDQLTQHHCVVSVHELLDTRQSLNEVVLGSEALSLGNIAADEPATACPLLLCLKDLDEHLLSNLHQWTRTERIEFFWKLPPELLVPDGLLPLLPKVNQERMNSLNLCFLGGTLLKNPLQKSRFSTPASCIHAHVLKVAERLSLHLPLLSDATADEYPLLQELLQFLTVQGLIAEDENKYCLTQEGRKHVRLGAVYQNPQAILRAPRPGIRRAEWTVYEMLLELRRLEWQCTFNSSYGCRAVRKLAYVASEEGDVPVAAPEGHTVTSEKVFYVVCRRQHPLQPCKEYLLALLAAQDIPS